MSKGVPGAILTPQETNRQVLRVGPSDVAGASAWREYSPRDSFATAASQAVCLACSRQNSLSPLFRSPGLLLFNPVLSVHIIDGLLGLQCAHKQGSHDDRCGHNKQSFANSVAFG
jgi:hypothetical protein